MAAKNGRAKYDFLSEGDSPAYFYLLDFGLRSTEDPSYGGLGGRFVKSPESPGLWDSSPDASDLNPFSGKPDPSYPQSRWIETLQNDFAVRADWCVREYSEVNHAPVVNLKNPSDILVSPGEKIRPGARAIDHDGDMLKYSWWQYNEAGKTIHLVLEVTDDGKPPLTRYQRSILTIK